MVGLLVGCVVVVISLFFLFNKLSVVRQELLEKKIFLNQNKTYKTASDTKTIESKYFVYILIYNGDRSWGWPPPKAPFSIATTPRCRGERYSIPRLAPLYPWYVLYNARRYQVPFFEYDSTWDWTLVSQAIDKNSNHLTNEPV